MSSPLHHHASRRAVLGGFGVAAGAVTLGASLPATLAAAAPGTAPAPEGAFTGATGLTYSLVDAAAFHTRVSSTGSIVDATSGITPFSFPSDLVAPLPLAPGAIVVELTVAYLSTTGSPELRLVKRPFGGAEATVETVALPAGGGAQTATKSTSVSLDGEATYLLVAALTAPGQSIKGVRVGYNRPNQGFQPFSGGNPRVYDSRSGAKLVAGEERIISLGLPGTIGAAVFNLTVTATEGAGYVAAFRADAGWPGNSSINWFGPGQDLANTTMCAVDGSGRIRLRGGGNATHVIIDLLGVLL